jgi:hypothetical protein
MRWVQARRSEHFGGSSVILAGGLRRCPSALECKLQITLSLLTRQPSLSDCLTCASALARREAESVPGVPRRMTAIRVSRAETTCFLLTQWVRGSHLRQRDSLVETAPRQRIAFAFGPTRQRLQEDVISAMRCALHPSRRREFTLFVVRHGMCLRR